MTKETNFYDHFIMGIEIEMETKTTRGIKNCAVLEWKSDGSLRKKQPGDTHLIELISHTPFKSQTDEDIFLEMFPKQLKMLASDKADDMFAFKNNSCGTHIHFSLKNYEPNYLWAFDSLEFEKDFFHAYMDTFKSEKFLERINSEYCRAPFLFSASGTDTEPEMIKRDLRKLNLLQYTEEKKKLSSSRYRWLNMEALDRGTGIEIRIYPHIQTVKGVRQVMDFTKKVLLAYFQKPSTQQRLKLLKIYEEKLKESAVDFEKLNTLKRIVYHSLKMHEAVTDSKISGEIRCLLAEWVEKQPGLLNKANEIL